ncbi:MAG: DegT/DnrJ/EryC1/StrS family aminotransferase [Bacteroidia bacterium]|nr:DegT/DnrJ/EryC1/StrS family aminotransferase [Bacteroidia bacterium]MDW8134164.1 DegT/DnrJ/EryC1/StrS family aminotransferase [Bacteroidia bacterium]
MEKRLPFHKPALSELEGQYLLAALEERYWGGGAWVERLEAKLSELYKREAVVVSSGTAALHLALTLLLGDKGGEVIVPTWTFTSTASEVIHAGGLPILSDVGETLHLTAERVEELLTPHTKGIIVMHYGGVPAPLAELSELCKQYSIWMIEDNCHAVPAYYQGKLCGTFGEISILSFHATKPIAAGQGGALLLQDKALADRARRLRKHGILRSPSTPWEYEVTEVGWNYCLSDFQAAVALAQLEKLEENWQRRKKIAYLYRSLLSELPEIRLYPVQEPESSAWHLFPVFWEGEALLPREQILNNLYKRGFSLNIHYKPLHRHKAYRTYVREGQKFPIADQAYHKIFTLPLWPDMSNAAIEALVEALTKEIKLARTYIPSR